jgi:HK97 gp10 family phage protein
MKIESEVLGLKELEAALKAVGESASPKILRQALRAGGDIIKKSVETNAAKHFESQTGLLENSIKIKAVLNKKQQHALFDAAVYVGVYPNKALQRAAGKDMPAAVYAYWLETGVKPHDLNRKSKRQRGKTAPGKNNFHPGIEPQPFIRPALLDNQKALIGTTQAELRRRIDNAVKRQQKSKKR